MQLIIDKNNLATTSQAYLRACHTPGYYWRVASVNEVGQGGMVLVWSFTTIRSSAAPAWNEPRM